MSKPRTPSSTNRESGRQSDLAVMDVDEYKQKRRLERILDAMDNVENLDSETLFPYSAGEISQDAKNIIQLRAVQEFIRECYNLLRRHAEDIDPEEGDKFWYGTPENPLGRIRMANGEDVVFYGLRDILHADRFYTETWTETEHPRNMPPREVQKEEQYTVPEEITWAAHLRLKEFLDIHNQLDLSFEDETLEVEEVAAEL